MDNTRQTLPFILAAILIFYFIITQIIAPFIVFRVLLTRKKRNKWSRSCSNPKDRELRAMYRTGMEWMQKNIQHMKEVSICSDGLRLAGLYFDFNFTNAVIILGGRQEACTYGLYFAETYRKLGFNVLCVDQRAHGLSEGILNTTGFKEANDILAWGNFLYFKKNNNKIIIHGICMGGATAIYAMAKKDCPTFFKMLVVEGVYTSFLAAFKNILKKFGVPTFPSVIIFKSILKNKIGSYASTEGPLTVIQEINRPILMLHGIKDNFSKLSQALEIMNRAPSPKRMVLFQRGSHSRLRFNDPFRYDRSITRFIRDYF